ncbi:MAG: CocE/NonD family hydrolase [Bacteroidota bacterium]
MKFYLFLLTISIQSFVSIGQNVDILLRQKVPMRDGIQLSADIYLPEGNKKPLPVILIYTPYLNDEAVERGMFFAKKDYVFISLDLRGRGNSEGVYFPFEKDGQDGYDAINWITQQPWCNGQVGMMGGSYRGMVQWMTLKEMPEALKTIVPTASVGPGIDFPKKNGVFYNYMLKWLTFTSGKGLNLKNFSNDEFWQSKGLKKIKEGLPFKDWDMTALNARNPIFQKWIAHPDFDEFWQNLYPQPEHYATLDLPILTITGYFDGDQPGALKYYEDHMTHGSINGKGRHYLVLGPWTHGGTRKPETEVGGLQFGKNAKIDMMQLHLEWFNWVFKNGAKPGLLKDRVNHFVMETNQWAHSTAYHQLAGDTLSFFLSSPENTANSLYNPGQLTETIPGREDPDSFIYNPLDTVQQAATNGDNYYLSPIPSVLKNHLIYLSDPMKKDNELIGRIALDAYISLNVKDTDITTTYYEIRADGQTIYLGNDRIRARYRNSLEKAEMVTPGKIELYQFKSSFFTNRKLLKGSRIAIIMGPEESASSQRNYNSGKDVSEETKDDSVIATVTLYHSKKYPSHLKIPVRREKK